MTTPRTAEFEHVQGPYDGDYSPVEVDENGVPVAFYTLGSMTIADMSIDPTKGFVSDLTTQFYDRDVRIDADGNPRYVFVFRGEVMNHAA